jgi:hypothetical protein
MTDDEFEALHAEVRRRLHGAHGVSRNSRNSLRRELWLKAVLN